MFLRMFGFMKYSLFCKIELQSCGTIVTSVCVLHCAAKYSSQKYVRECNAINYIRAVLPWCLVNAGAEVLDSVAMVVRICNVLLCR